MADNFACLTIDPKNPTGPKVDAIFPGDLTTRLYKYSPVRYENLRAAKYVLEKTERIYFGVREFNEGGWYYTGRSPQWYTKEAVEAPFPKEMIFAVYLNPNMRVYECRAERCANDDSFAPEDWQNRYSGLIWKNSFGKT